MKVFSPATFLAFLATFAIANIPKDFQATNTEATLFAQQNPDSTPKPTTTPTEPPSPTPPR
ncbi:hypothetical protein WJM97_20070 [Okeanomitos corallinicola TIOX110]|uniref:Uncharacterized protein n=1 Tax=Okeanomitos corallinicola TIOX110 TaxID=3133117 RepID=A0ABZ2UQR1_9CYAN